MSLLSRFTGKRRLRSAAMRLGLDPSATNYCALAREYVVTGDLDEVMRVCDEGLDLHPGNPELRKIVERAQKLQVESRVRVVQQELSLSPRPALFRELCDLLIQSGRYVKAEEHARAWKEVDDSPEADYFLARCLASRFFESRRAQDGKQAYELARGAAAGMRSDLRPLELQYEIASACGAWAEGRSVAARMLELAPGRQDYETRFRNAVARSHGARSLLRALAEVESSGRLVDDPKESSNAQANVAVRPLLQELGRDPGVKAAIFQRGGTALVQGLHGATADRTARAVREVVQTSRGMTRRLGLGRPLEVLVEGEFGSLMLSPGDLGAAAVWCLGRVEQHHAMSLQSISGAAGATLGGQA